MKKVINALLYTVLLCGSNLQTLKAQSNGTYQPQTNGSYPQQTGSYPQSSGPTNSEIERKMDDFIGVMNDTKFISAYKDYKVHIEGLGAELKTIPNLEQREIAKAKILYTQSKTRFDGLIDQLRRDICNPSTRKLIAKHPEQYTANYQRRMDEARFFCDNNFVKKADSLLRKEGIELEPISLVVNSLIAIFKMFGGTDSATNEISAKYLETNFIEKLWLREWARLE